MYAYLQQVPIEPDIYAKVKDRLGSEPLAGLVVHLALRSPDGGLTCVDLWESREACDRAFHTSASTLPSSASSRRSAFSPTASPSARSWRWSTCSRVTRCLLE